jgi:YfiH family protein
LYTTWHGSDQPIGIKPFWPDNRVSGLFSFRLDGFSEEPYDSLNLGLHVNDHAQHVLGNRSRITRLIGGTLSDWVVGQQVHGRQVALVSNEDRGRGATPASSPIAETDALVTNVQGITLAVMAADCVPVLFFDPVRGAIGAAHSGWKGTVAHISAEVILAMQEHFGTNPGDVEVWLGPSIRQCCYEVDDRVAEPIGHEFGLSHLIKRFYHPNKYLLNLQSCIRSDLQNSGVRAVHIHDTGLCTSCHTDVTFSHRAEHGRTGRLAGLIRLNP